MIISDHTSQKASLTQVNRALQHFTDRSELIFRFAEYLNDEKINSKKILFFYGDGGNGKSLLLKFLIENCCKCFPRDIWQEIKSKETYAERVELIKTFSDWECDSQFVPAALLDFEPPLKRSQEEQPQDLFDGLVMLRKQLVINAARLGYTLSFPLYEYACIWYLHKKGKLTNEYVTKLFPSPELFLVGGIINTVKTFVEENKELAAFFVLPSLAASTLNIVAKYWGKNLTRYLHRCGLKDKDFQQQIDALDPNTELIAALPNFFAEDLKVALERLDAPEKLVLFFDTHEAFWGERRNYGRAVFFKRDEWLRCLLVKLLDLPKIVVVITGREIPVWHQAQYCSIAADKLECKQVLNFKVVDALNYLEKVGIEPRELRECLITYTRFDSDLIHPLLLGFCADLVRLAQERGEVLTCDDFQTGSQTGQAFNQKLAILVERLLKYADRELEDAVYTLSACRAFNEELYFHLGEPLKFNPSHVAFDSLLCFSFVWRAEQQQGDEWYRLHPLIRHLHLQQRQERTQAAHQVLESYYRTRGNPGTKENLVEAIYHASWQDSLRAKEEYTEVLKLANQQEDNELCRMLEEIRKEMPF